MRTKSSGMHIPDILSDPVYCMPCYDGPTKTTTITSCAASCPLPNAAADLFKKTTMALKIPSSEEKREEPVVEPVKPKEKVKAVPPPPRQADYEDQVFPIIPYLASVVSLVCIAFVAFWGELLQLRVRKEKHRQGYTPLYTWWENFYRNHLLRRVWSAMFTPIVSPPGPNVTVLNRLSSNQGWTIRLTTTTKECINLGSYNYLDMSEKNSPTYKETVKTLREYGVGQCFQGRVSHGTNVHEELDRNLAEFIGVEDALTFGMGFATNSLNISTIMNSDSLIFSDELNHASIILSLRLTRAKIRVFKHNDMVDLESQIRKHIIAGNRGRPWKKIFIVVEGVYSMHGSISRLPELIRIKEKYGTLIYLDEAHCMGALGATGRGVTEYFNIDPKKIDIMMGTFAKSFGGIGGYIAGSKKLVDSLRRHSAAHLYGTVMPASVAAFLLEGVKLLRSQDGQDRITNLQRNTRYFRQRLEQMGFIVSGALDSPVIPVAVPMAALVYIVDFMRDRNVAAVMVSYPATPITEGRIRCCLNAHHTREMIDYVLKCFDELADTIGILRISSRPRELGVIEY